MSVQVLITTVNNNDLLNLLKKMNVKSNAIIGNQCEKNEINEFDYLENKVLAYSFAEKGVGLNRNNLLMRATADYCIFADDDLIYVDGYEKIVEKAFYENPNADVIIFNLKEKVKNRYVIKKKIKIGRFRLLKFGAARIAYRNESIKRNGIFFNLLFGGGTRFSFGEDTIFLNECYKKGLNIIGVPIYLAELTEERPSTWFQGYNAKFFEDKGVVYFNISKNFYKFFCLQDAIRHRKKYKIAGSWYDLYKKMIIGVKKYNNLCG